MSPPPRRCLAAAALSAALAVCAPAEAGTLTVKSTSPSPLVLGEPGPFRVVLSGLEPSPVGEAGGQGTLQADVNVGRVLKVERSGEDVVVSYEPPRLRAPQMLCLALWRDSGPEARIHIVRVPMLGRTRLPVRTRMQSTVVVRVGKRTFGPTPTGWKGRVRIPVQVPPGVTRARVTVTDRAKLTTHKTVAIRRRRYNQLTMAISPSSSRSSVPRFRITVAAAEATGERPILEVAHDTLPLRRAPGDAWTALWAPAARPEQGTVVPIVARLPGKPRSTRQARVGIGPVELAVSVVRVRSGAPLPRAPSRFGWRLGLSAGMVHNLGELVSPRFGLELGVDYPLPAGRIGLRLFSSFAWAGQTIAADPLPDARARVLLWPVGLGLTYRYDLRHLSPYALAGAMVQFVRSTTEAPYAGERVRDDVAFGVLGLLGAERELGPGRLFLQAGYQWSEVDNVDVNVLAGGVVLEGGYRLVL